MDNKPLKLAVKNSKSFGVKQNNTANHRLHKAVERYLNPLRPEEILKNRAEIKAANDTQYERLIAAWPKIFNIERIKDYKQDPEELSLTSGESILRIKNKPHYPDHSSILSYGTDYENTSKISCFNKTQIKCKTDPGSCGSDLNVKYDSQNDMWYVKGEQGISAAPKALNNILLPPLKRAEELLMKNTKPGILFATGMNDCQLRDVIRQELSRADPTEKYKIITVDISQQDTTKTEATYRAIRWLYQNCGVSDHILELWIATIEQWFMTDRLSSIKVFLNYLSGYADTLLNNSLDSISGVFSLFNMEGLIFAGVKGDDLILVLKQMKAIAGYKIPDYYKFTESDIGAFVGFIMTPNDIYLDIIRIAARLLTKNEDENSRHEQLRLAAADNIKMITSLENREAQVSVNAYYYGIPAGDVHTILSYLENYSRRKKTTLPVLFDKKRWNRATRKMETHTVFNEPYFVQLLTVPFEI